MCSLSYPDLTPGGSFSSIVPPTHQQPMAEVFAVVSAGIGVAAFTLQVADKIERLKAARQLNQGKAEEELEFLIQRLEVLRANLQGIETIPRSSAVDLAVDNCQSAWSSVDTILQKVAGKLARISNSKLKMGKHAGDIKEDLRQARERVDSVINDLTLTCILAHTYATSLRTIKTNTLISTQGVDELPSANGQTGQLTSTECARSDSNTTVTAVVRSPRGTLSQRRRLDCTVKHCHCSCHSAKRSSGRHWALEYTPLSIFAGTCSNPQCTATRYRWSLQFALTRYGVPFRMNTALELLSGGGKYALRPALTIERVVRYTSPGFETLWRFQQGLISLSETRERFRELNKCDPSMRQHVNPGGRNYVQELIYYGPNLIVGQIDQFDLLRFFAHELGMTLENEDQRFLVRCAKWVGEGWHLDLLETILHYGFDPGCIESPVYQDWPAACSPNWISLQFTDDPFFIDYLTILVQASPGFAGSTPLHDAVLLGSPASVKSFLSRSTLHMEKNFLGQTPLHLAVHHEGIVRLLAEAGHDLDVMDSQGATPLMYAAAMNKTNVVELLINKGANPLMQDLDWKRDFIAHAAARGNWELIMHALSTIKASYSQQAFQLCVRLALMSLISRPKTWLGAEAKWGDYFTRLVGLISDPNFMFRDGHQGTDDNNLLHYIADQKDATVLVQHGFKLFNRPNSEGRTAMFSLARIMDSNLTQFLVDQGTDINVVDRQGHTVLFSLLDQLSPLGFTTWDIMDSIQVCLRAGSSIFTSDGCRCHCSPEGCSLPTAFKFTFSSDLFTGASSFVWALEFVSLIEELRGVEDAKRLLVAFLRRMEFDRRGLTHVCCRRKYSVLYASLFPPKAIADDDVDEILDEEEDFIAELEDEMSSLSLGSLECLRSKLMVMLRERYKEDMETFEEHEEKFKKHHRPKVIEHKVDYKNDTYCSIYSTGNFNVRPSVSDPMATYIIWLEHQYGRPMNPDHCDREAWYNRRMTWFVGLMQVMQLDAKDIVDGIDHLLEFRSWEGPDNPNKDRITEHFLASVKRFADSS